MKKLVSIMLLLVMLCTMLISCGSNAKNPGEDQSDEQNTDNIGGGDIIGGWDDPENPLPDDPKPEDPTPDDPKPEDPTPDDPNQDIDPDLDPDPNVNTVYLLNRAEWEAVAIYYWGGEGEIEGGWPGKKLELGSNLLYKATVDSKYSRLIFNNENGTQTADLDFPTDDKIVFDNLENVWITFDRAIEIIRGEGLDPHAHVFVDGKCECGETDPNYNPNPDPDPEDPDPDPTPGIDLDPDLDPDPTKVTVYLLNRADWRTVSVYYWNEEGSISGGWPGAELTKGSNLLYKASFDMSYVRVIFNNREGIQTADLTVPTDDKIVFDNKANAWITFDEAIALLREDGLDPHAHIFVEGECECGATDPNYDPNQCPHDVYDIVEVAPTCTEKGSKTHTCTECGYNYTLPIAATGHQNLETIPGKAATCGEAGLTDGKKCLDCGAVTLKQTTINATGKHNFVSAVCTVCGTEEMDMDEELALFYALFDETSKVTFKLDISNSELKKIQQDFEKCYKSPIYRMADLIVTITTADGKTGTWTIPQVGVRMKGNTSRTNFYSDDQGMYNLIHFKISFQETFDDAEHYGNDALLWLDAAARKERKNRTFATLEKIDIRWNRNDDTTYIKENYAYELYREFGVLAPHTNLASVDIGKDHAGVWVFYEPIDDIFLEKNLPAEALGGDLYKLGWTNEGATFTSFSSYGIEDELANKFYVYDLKTNKKTSTHESLKKLIQSINSGSITKESFSSLVDMENFINYCAVSYMIGNPDDLRNNYNNSYIYFRPDTGKMIVIPYDMDRGFGINRDWNPYGDSQTTDDPFSKRCVSGDQKNPLFLRTVCYGGMFIEEYKAALQAVSDHEMLDPATFAQSFNIAANLYGSDTKTSKTYHNAGGHRFYFDNQTSSGASGGGNMSFAKYIEAKQATLNRYLNGTSGGGDNSGSDDTYQPITNCDPYLRGEFNNWLNDGWNWDNYKMTANDDGTFSFTLTDAYVSSSGRIKFKIFDNSNGAWYGYEIVDPNCTVNANDSNGNGNGNKNIYLAPGTYLLTFDPTTVTLYIEKQ